jgi:hypothetical protein
MQETPQAAYLHSASLFFFTDALPQNLISEDTRTFGGYSLMEKRQFVDGMWRWEEDPSSISPPSSPDWQQERSVSPWMFLLPIGFVVGSVQVGLVTSFLLPMMTRWQGAPYVPTAHAKVNLIFNRLLAHTSVEGKAMYDLG